MRLFVGIELSAESVKAIAAVSAEMGGHVEGVHWSRPEGWHITLQFLGSAAEEQKACVVRALAEVRSPGVPVRMGEVDVFGRGAVLFVGVLVTPELRALQ